MTANRRCLGFAALALSMLSVCGAVKLPAVFGDHMVLQRGCSIPVWGWAAPGEAVTVTLGQARKQATADAQGRWRVDLPEMTVATGLTLTVSADNTLTLSDVAVGDVWVGSGQSNMQWTVSNTLSGSDAIAAADFPGIRLFDVPRVTAGSPQDDVKATWTPCTPASVPSFSAVLYYFGRELHRELDVPLGLIATSWGGTRIEPWTPPVGFESVPALTPIRDRVRLATASSNEHKEALKAAIAQNETWLGEARQALAAESAIPALPGFNAGLLPLNGNQLPCSLYNAMVHPLIPYAIRGAIWYQGEANLGDGEAYFEKMKALIGGWRSVWDQGDFPFYFVQLAPYRYGASPELLPRIWMAQTQSLTIPNTGMAVTHDIGNVTDIHPRNKTDVGRRLALWALAKTYGRDGLVHSGPLYRSCAVEEGCIRVSFDHVGSGLASRDGEPLTRFELIGRDTEWETADAVLDGNTVVVSSAAVPNPVAVRFAWHQEAEPNLMNREGLPAPAFIGGTVPVRVNVALNKPYDVSNPNTYGPNWRLGLTDGNWGSDDVHCMASGDAAEFPKHATVDLGSEHQVNRIVCGTPAFGSTKDVTILAGPTLEALTDVGQMTVAQGKAERKTIRFPMMAARYIRLTYTANYETKVHYDNRFVFTNELEVFGPVD